MYLISYSMILYTHVHNDNPYWLILTSKYVLYVADAWTFCFVIMMAANEIYERKFLSVKPLSTSDSPKVTESVWDEN